jgi:hypothetical protein
MLFKIQKETFVIILLEHARLCINCNSIHDRENSPHGDCPACLSKATVFLSDMMDNAETTILLQKIELMEAQHANDLAAARTEAIQQAVAVPYKPLWMRP